MFNNVYLTHLFLSQAGFFFLQQISMLFFSIVKYKKRLLRLKIKKIAQLATVGVNVNCKRRKNKLYGVLLFSASLDAALVCGHDEHSLS